MITKLIEGQLVRFAEGYFLKSDEEFIGNLFWWLDLLIKASRKKELRLDWRIATSKEKLLGQSFESITVLDTPSTETEKIDIVGHHIKGDDKRLGDYLAALHTIYDKQKIWLSFRVELDFPPSLNEYKLFPTSSREIYMDDIAAEIAQQLNGLIYGAPFPDDLIERAQQNNIIICHGQSDDLLEIDGAITEEYDLYEGGIVKVSNDLAIEAVWDPDKSMKGPSWRIKPIGLGYYLFRIWEDHEDGDLYCEVCVIQL